MTSSSPTWFRISRRPASPFKDVTGSSSSSPNVRARTGTLYFPNSLRRPIDTPAGFTPSSRGVISHLSPDHLDKYAANICRSLFLGLEDFLEKYPRPPALLSQSPNIQLRDILCLPPTVPLTLSCRRSAAHISPQPNTDHTVGIMTPEGFRQFKVADYMALGLEKVQPDVLLSCPDLPNLSPGARAGVNRSRKMINRNSDWLEAHMDSIDAISSPANPLPLLFAPVIPALLPQEQSIYLQLVQDRLASNTQASSLLTGLCFWDTAIVGKAGDYTVPTNGDFPELYTLQYPLLEELLRMWMPEVSGPHDVLDKIVKGFDLFNLDFVGRATDAGVALTFSLEGPSPPSQFHDDDNDDGNVLPLGINLWDPCHIKSMEPFVVNCSCYACKNHNRAYVHHLLNANEMLAWVLLQLHNLEIADQFMKHVRKSIADESFANAVDIFRKTYRHDDFRLNKGLRVKTSPKSLSEAITDSSLAETQEQAEKEINDPIYQATKSLPRLRGYQVPQQRSGHNTPKLNKKAFKGL